MIKRLGLYFLRIICAAFFPNEPVPPVIKIFLLLSIGELQFPVFNLNGSFQAIANVYH
jgi:hypothetical protein